MTGREETIRAIEDNKIIVILRGFGEEDLVKTVAALRDGGIRLCEVTYDAKGEPSDDVTAARIARLAREFPDMYVGAGTVLTEEQVTLSARAGGRFIISPDTNTAVIAKTRAEGLVSIPGAFTATEAAAAGRAGADFIKLFPVRELSPAYIKDLRAPLSHLRFLAVGGVTLDTMPAYLEAGACGVGVATAIADKKLVAAGDYAGVAALARRWVETARG